MSRDDKDHPKNQKPISTAPMSRLNRTLLALLIMFVASAAILIACGFALSAFRCQLLDRRMIIEYAVYPRMRAILENDEIVEVKSFVDKSQDGELARLYVRNPDGDVFFVPNLSEDLAVKWCGAENPNWIREQRAEPLMIYPVGPWVAHFRMDKLVGFRIVVTSTHGIGLSQDGPFYHLPLSRGKFVEVFGEPLHWEKEAIKGMP